MAFVIDSWLELVCPVCKSELFETRESKRHEGLRCEGCALTYPIVLGIPDLRIFPDPYISILGDWTKGRMLHEQFTELDLAGIVALYFHVTPEVPEKDVVANTSRLLGGVGRAEVALDSWDRSFGATSGERLLDVGCGTAPLLVAAAKRYARPVGIDVAFRWLVIGKKRLLQEGVKAPLIAACAEALPFREGMFDLVTVQSALEVLKDQRAAVRESFRVLRSGGRALVSTPNRFSLGPDPHIGVFGGSYLPWGLVSAIARLQMARPPERTLLSARSLRRRLAEAGFREVRVAIPGVSESQQAQFHGLSRSLARAYDRLHDAPGFKQALTAIGPLLQASGAKA
jgi:SAM-dependent methyltransferase